LRATPGNKTAPTRWVGVIVVLVLLAAATAGLLKARDTSQDAPAGAVLGTGPARATATSAPRSRTFVAVADAKVDAANPDRDYGSSTTLRVDAQPVVRSYLRFKVRGLRGTVRSAVLRVWANSRQRPGYRVHRLGAAAWSEGTITFARQPAATKEPTPLGSSGPVTAGSWTSVDVTPLLHGDDGLRSLVLETNGTTGLSLASREDTAHAPRLVVETG
jgi:hypothetical protein